MKNKLNKELVSAIRGYFPEGESCVAFLMNLLLLGKESVYRRLRGEIPFTFEEVVAISSKLEFSVDFIVGVRKKDHVFFDLNLHRGRSSEDVYFRKVEQFTTFFNEVRKAKSSLSMFAMNYIPYSFSMYCRLFTKFRYYKWTHQTQETPPHFTMSDLFFPQRIVHAQKVWSKDDRHMMQVVYILDKQVFLSVARDIDYFYRRNLITDKELYLMQTELLEMISGLEELAKTGVTDTGAKVTMYLSGIDVETTYSYFEYDDNVSCHIQIYGLDVLESRDRQACAVQKEWIEQLKRYSILITQSGEMQRFEYFKKQREYIRDIGV